ncbi:MAG TPA: ABC transporter substrate-binding protein [Micropepsaceae bacterium]|jgi:ABC-type transporter MlaC component|nr:ABC transporter substrate-binding protein [Micropepsaceae bacterium]
MWKKLALSGLLAFCVVLPVRPASASPATEAFIQQNFDKGYAILNSASLSYTERRDQFRTLLLRLAASRRIALFALGPYSSGATPAQLDGFVEAFTAHVVSLYEKALSRYNGQALKVTGSTDRGADDSIVQAAVIDPDQPSRQPVNVAFRVRPNESDRLTITDVQVGGLSLATMARVEIGALMLECNGSISELNSRLMGMR